jgi:hypothetical protein
MRSLSDVLDEHSDIGASARRLILTAHQVHPLRAELDRQIAEGAWLLGSPDPDGRMALRIGHPGRIDSVPLLRLPANPTRAAGQG